MSRVLISFYQLPIDSNVNLLFCYYEALANELKNSGNEVLLLNVAFFKTNDWLGPVTAQKEHLKKSVKNL